MGTETQLEADMQALLKKNEVKLNNPQMGTETTTYRRMVQVWDIRTLN